MACKSTHLLQRFIRQEKKRTSDFIGHTFRNVLYHEMRQRIVRTSASVPERLGGFEYFMQQHDTMNYPIYYRQRCNEDEEREVVLNQNQFDYDSTYFKRLYFHFFSRARPHGLGQQQQPVSSRGRQPHHLSLQRPGEVKSLPATRSRSTRSREVDLAHERWVVSA